MSLYGALNIGVAGLDANSAALSATSSNIANVNTVGYKEATASFSTFLNATPAPAANCLRRRHRHDRPGRHRAGPADHDIVAHRPVDLGQRLLRGGHQHQPPPRPQEYTRAGSFTPDANGNLVNAAGLYLLGWKLDAARQVRRPIPAISAWSMSTPVGHGRSPPATSRSRPICSPARPWTPAIRPAT